MGLKTIKPPPSKSVPSCTFPPSHIEAHFPNDFHVTQIGKQKVVRSSRACMLLNQAP